MKGEAVDILLIEDNTADVELTLRAFRKNNIVNNVFVIQDGEEALDYLFMRGKFKEREESRPKLILLDLKLPKVSGLEILKTIKSDKRLRMIPTVVLTSSREEMDLIRSYRLGVNSYIVKPVDFNGFQEAVKNLGLYWLLVNKAPEIDI